MDLYILIATHLIYFTAGLCLLNAIAALMRTGRSANNAIHSFQLLCTALLLVRIGLYGSDVLYRYPAAIFFFITSLYLLGPLNLIYNHVLINPERPLPRTLIWQFVPAILTLVAELYFQCVPASGKVDILRAVLHKPLDTMFSLSVAVGAGSLSIYNGQLFLSQVRLVLIADEKQVVRLLCFMNFIGLLSVPISMTGFFVTSEALMKTGGLLSFLVFCIDYMARSRYPDLFNIVRREIKRDRYRRQIKQGIEPAMVYNRLEELMRDERIFQDFETSLASVATMLGIRPHHLSGILNEYYHTTFKDYLNGYRIGEAMRLLRGAPPVNILSICYEVGFSSKSNFNSTFKRITGLTPQEYHHRSMGENR